MSSSLFPGTTLFLLGFAYLSASDLLELLDEDRSSCRFPQPRGRRGHAWRSCMEAESPAASSSLGCSSRWRAWYAKVLSGPREPTLWRGHDVRGWWQIGSVLWSVLALMLTFTTLSPVGHTLFPTVYTPQRYDGD